MKGPMACGTFGQRRINSQQLVKMERLEQYDFPCSHAMMGSVIPGVRQPFTKTTRATYPDRSVHKKLVKDGYEIDPVKRLYNESDPTKDFYGRLMAGLQKTTYDKMAQPHAPGHGVMSKLKELLGHTPGAEMQPGYEETRENRDWRTS